MQKQVTPEEFARIQLNGYFVTGDGGFMNPNKSPAFRAMERQAHNYRLRRLLYPGPSKHGEISAAFGRAIEGNAEAICDVLEMAIDCLTDDRKMPGTVATYAMFALLNPWQVAARRCGRRLSKNTGRNEMIVRTIDGLFKHFRLRPTRNRDAPTTDSGCSIVTKILAEYGARRTEAAVEKIWEARDRAPRSSSGRIRK